MTEPKRMRIAKMCACAICLLALAVIPAGAQVYSASITGVVQDPSGAVIPQATVTATDAGKGSPFR